MKSIEKAVRTQIQGFGARIEADALAAVAVNLASRLDAGPSERDAVGLAHELRMILLELRRQAGDEGTSDVERILDRIAAPELGHSAN
jgi:hypothetical protein